MEWYQVHYRLGELWEVLRDEEGCEVMTAMETFARMTAKSLIDRNLAVEAMVVKVLFIYYSELETKKQMSFKEYSVKLPLLV